MSLDILEHIIKTGLKRGKQNALKIYHAVKESNNHSPLALYQIYKIAKIEDRNVNVEQVMFDMAALPIPPFTVLLNFHDEENPMYDQYIYDLRTILSFLNKEPIENPITGDMMPEEEYHNKIHTYFQLNDLDGANRL